MKKLSMGLSVLIMMLFIFIPVTANDGIDISDDFIEVELDELKGAASKNFSISEINQYGVKISAWDKTLFVDYEGNSFDVTNAIENNRVMFYDGIAAVKANGSYGYINDEYEWIVPPAYKSAGNFSCGFGIVTDENGESFVMDTSGDAKFRSTRNIRPFVDGIAIVDDAERIDYKILDQEPNSYDAPQMQEYYICDYKYGYILGRKEDSVNNTQIYSLFDSEGNIVSSYDMGAFYSHTGGKCLPNGKAIVFGVGDINSNGAEIYDEKTALFSKDGENVSIDKNIFEDYSAHKIGHFNNEYIITCSGEIYDYGLNRIGELDIDASVKEVVANGDVVAVLPLQTSDAKYDDYGDYSVPWLECDRVDFIFAPGFWESYKAPTYVDIEKLRDVSNDTINVYINSDILTFDKQPILENDRTLVPLRAIFEALEAEVAWDNDTNTATAVKDGTTISITIDSDVMYKNGEAVQLDAPARLIDDGYTFVPLRAVSEALDCDVQWNEEQQRVDITYEEEFDIEEAKANLPEGWAIEDDDEYYGYYYLPDHDLYYFTECGPFSDGLAPASQSGRDSSKKYYGYIDEYGYFVIPDIYTQAGRFVNGVAVVKSDLYPYPYRINTKGECIDDIVFEKNTCEETGEDYTLYEENGLYGYKDASGEVVIEAAYEDAYLFSDGMALVKARTYDCTGADYDAYNCYGYINAEGKLITPFDYMGYSSDFNEGSAVVYKSADNDGLRGWFIDKNGEKLFDGRKFISGEPFSEELAVVQLHGEMAIKDAFVPRDEEENEYTYIDRDGNFATDERYDYAGSFEDGYAIVVKDGVKYRINKDFEIVEKLAEQVDIEKEFM